jgi:hypothetical protein
MPQAAPVLSEQEKEFVSLEAHGEEAEKRCVMDPLADEDHQQLLAALDAEPDDEPPLDPNHSPAGGVSWLPEEHYNAALWEAGEPDPLAPEAA